MEHVPKILGLCKSIAWMSQDAKSFRNRCQQLAARVKVLEELVESVRQKTISPEVSRTLGLLAITLVEGHELVKKCARTHFVNLVTCYRKFKDVNDNLRDAYPVLAAVGVSQGAGKDNAGLFSVSDDESDDSDDDSDTDSDYDESMLAVYSEELELGADGLFYKHVRVYYPE